MMTSSEIFINCTPKKKNSGLSFRARSWGFPPAILGDGSSNALTTLQQPKHVCPPSYGPCLIS